MADTVQVDWLYPPLFENLSEDQRQGTVNYCVKLSGLSDGTGETDVQKVDISELRLPGVNRGSTVTRTSISKIKYNVYGMTAMLEWDRAPNVLIARMRDEGEYCYSPPLVDQGSSGDGTGDLILTTTDADPGDFYEITIWFRGKEDMNEGLAI